jgi:transcriptional regulator with XRE-family HTH domain
MEKFIMTTIGDRIQQRRTEMNLSLAELARRADLSKGYLHAIESGTTQSPSAEILFRLANELSTTIADLLGEVEIADHKREELDIPDGLRQLAEEDDLTPDDVEMLARIEYRGKRPENVKDWRYIFESIRRTLK